MIQEVQCPVFGFVRKAKVKGQQILITLHKPRTVRADRNGARWMHQDLEWVLVQKKGVVHLLLVLAFDSVAREVGPHCEVDDMLHEPLTKPRHEQETRARKMQYA